MTMWKIENATHLYLISNLVLKQGITIKQLKLRILPTEKCAGTRYSYSKPFPGQKRKGLLASAGSAVSSAQTLTNMCSLP